MGQGQEGAKKGEVDVGPGSQLHEIFAAGQGTTETEDEDVLEKVFAIGTLSAGVGNGLGPLHQFARLGYHRRSFRPHENPLLLFALTPLEY